MRYWKGFKDGIPIALGYLSVSFAFKLQTIFFFPVVLLGALWNFGLEGIWFNFVGVNALAAVLSLFLSYQFEEQANQEFLLAACGFGIAAFFFFSLSLVPLIKAIASSNS
mgnify:CR=1 FL=1